MKTDREVFEYHGYEEQCKHITSEMHELTSAIQKFELSKGTQNVIPNWNNICEEVADVEFMLNQIKEYYFIQDEYVKPWGVYKRKRESKRIEEGYYERKQNENN